MSEVKEQLPMQCVSVFTRWIAGYKVANIAADLGVNAHTVKE